MSNKSIGILVMLVLSVIIIIYGTRINFNQNHTHCQTDGWEMDTLYHPTNPNRFNVSLHYYQEIEYIIDTVEVIEEDGVRWYTLDTIRYDIY